MPETRREQPKLTAELEGGMIRRGESSIQLNQEVQLRDVWRSFGATENQAIRRRLTMVALLRWS
jgi:hypothetical protein